MRPRHTVRPAPQAEKIEEHSEARINSRRQRSQREIGKAIAQDVVSDFIEQFRSTI
jgi:hypothetical protein